MADLNTRKYIKFLHNLKTDNFENFSDSQNDEDFIATSSDSKEPENTLYFSKIAKNPSHAENNQLTNQKDCSKRIVTGEQSSRIMCQMRKLIQFLSQGYFYSKNDKNITHEFFKLLKDLSRAQKQIYIEVKSVVELKNPLTKFTRRCLTRNLFQKMLKKIFPAIRKDLFIALLKAENLQRMESVSYGSFDDFKLKNTSIDFNKEFEPSFEKVSKTRRWSENEEKLLILALKIMYHNESSERLRHKKLSDFKVAKKRFICSKSLDQIRNKMFNTAYDPRLFGQKVKKLIQRSMTVKEIKEFIEARNKCGNDYSAIAKRLMRGIDREKLRKIWIRKIMPLAYKVRNDRYLQIFVDPLEVSEMWNCHKKRNLERRTEYNLEDLDVAKMLEIKTSTRKNKLREKIVSGRSELKRDKQKWPFTIQWSFVEDREIVRMIQIKGIDCKDWFISAESPLKKFRKLEIQLRINQFIHTMSQK